MLIRDENTDLIIKEYKIELLGTEPVNYFDFTKQALAQGYHDVFVGCAYSYDLALEDALDKAMCLDWNTETIEDSNLDTDEYDSLCFVALYVQGIDK